MTVMNTNTTTTTPSFLVVGANGKTGRRVAERLTAAGHALRAVSRSTTPPFDWYDASTWPAALDGIDRAYITFQPDIAVPGAAPIFEAFAIAAAEHGLERLVLLSGRNEPAAEACERILLESGVNTAVVRCSFFAQNFSEHFLYDAVADGVIALPAGDVLEPIIDADDIADVAFLALTEDGHVGRVHELTGPRLMSFHDAAADLSAATGREIVYLPVTPEQYIVGAIDAGVPPEEAEMLGALFAEIFDGRSASVTNGVTDALHRPPRDFADFAIAATAAGAWNYGTAEMSVERLLLAAAATSVGVTSGVMFCFQTAVMPGLGRLTDREFIAAFQAMDAEIVNPVFVGPVFLGGGALLVAATVAHRDEPRRFRRLATASAIYLAGVVAVTMGGNVPKNNKLAAFQVASSTIQGAAAARQEFEGPWNRLHIVRTLASVASLVALSMAMVTNPRHNI